MCLKHIKKTFNKTFKELQNEYPHDHLEGGGQKMRSYFQGGMPIAVRMRTGVEGGGEFRYLATTAPVLHPLIKLTSDLA